MRKLNTIQKRNNLNEVFAEDETGPGEAHHRYVIKDIRKTIPGKKHFSNAIWFQKGPRGEEDSQHGVIDSDLLEIVRDRLKSFQEGDYSSEYNAKALEHIELALMYLNRRVEDRLEREVLGTYNK